MTDTSERLLVVLTKISTARQVCRDAEAERLLGQATDTLRDVIDAIAREQIPGTEYRG